MMMRFVGVGGVVLALVGTACSGSKIGSKDLPGRLSDAERQAVESESAKSGSSAITVFHSDGKFSSHQVKFEGLQKLENKILESDPGAVLFLDQKAVGIARGVQDSGTGLNADENLLFRGKEIFELSAWEKSFPDADGRGVKIAVVDDGVALNREGLIQTRDGRAKFAKSINAGTSWLVPVRLKADGCARRTVLTEGQSAAWKIVTTSIPQSADWSFSQAFDIHPCGINGDLPLANQCMAWEKVFPNGKARMIDGNFVGAARFVEFKDLSGKSKQRVLFDVSGDGVISDEEVFTAFSDTDAGAAGGTIYPLMRGDAIGFDIHPVQATAGGHPFLPTQSRDFPVSDCSANSTVDFAVTFTLPNNSDSDFGSHGDGVAGIAAGYKIGKRNFDGVAPGAQVVDVHFGDSISDRRYTISEIGRVLLLGGRSADIVNLSYSLFFDSAASQVAMGRFLTAMLNQTDAIYFFSAGNNGPGRGSMNRALLYPADSIQVGAYLDPLLAQTTFGSSTPYGGVVSYSSRGPGADGSSGPLLLSPLAGITVYPGETMGYGPFSGTSSATPALSGFTARLISQIRAEGLPVKRTWLRQALISSAVPISGFHFIDQGYGVPKLSAALTKYREIAGQGRILPRLEVTGADNSRGVPSRGIYVRGSQDRQDTYRFALMARFTSEWPVQDQANYAEAFALEADQPWISTTPNALVSVRGANAEVALDWAKIDAMGPGEYLGLVRLKSLDTGDLRAVIPVTILKPQTGGQMVLNQKLAPGEVTRVFLESPAGADHLLLKRISQSVTQPICGELRAYNPSGIVIAAEATRKSASVEQSAFPVGQGGFFEIVWLGGRSHVSCPAVQSLSTQIQWSGIRAEMQQASASKSLNLSFRVLTDLPSQAGEISIGGLGSLKTLKATRAAGQTEYSFPVGTATAKGFESSARLSKSFFAARVSAFSYPYATLNYAETAGVGIQSKLNLPDTGAWIKIPSGKALEGISIFDEGSSSGLTSREIEIDLFEKFVGPFSTQNSVVDRTWVDVGQTRPMRFNVTVPYNLGDKGLFNDWSNGTLRCEFRPAGFEMDLGCGTLKTQVW
ncbi:MAG: S8 family serine peptidase [Bdellovibrionales bacterium]|nr:S8 family serine peptidase [Bdellovibrionales bacterium]